MPLESSPLDATNKLEAHGVVDVETWGKQETKDYVYAVVYKDRVETLWQVSTSEHLHAHNIWSLRSAPMQLLNLEIARPLKTRDALLWSLSITRRAYCQATRIKGPCIHVLTIYNGNFF